MLAEIYEQPEALRRTLAAYVEGTSFRRDVTDPISEWLRKQTQVVIAASGSSRHAGLVGEVLLEDISSLPVDVEYASEYSYRSPQAPSSAGVIVISQSGETGDTLQALRRAIVAGQPTLAITNVPGSTMMREASVPVPTLAGPERAIPATKSFTAQLLVLELLSLLAAEVHGSMGAAAIAERLGQLTELPARIERQLVAWQAAAQRAVEATAEASSFLFCGRSLHYAIAREGALKLKESAYLHAEAYPSGELRHGPTALVSPETPVFMIATVQRDLAGSVQRYDSSVQLLQDLHGKGATLVAIANADDSVVPGLADQIVSVEPGPEPVTAICEVIPLQLFAYLFAVHRGIDVDRPRNLVKAVLAV
jgi:glutamine---fructose-6-phosphate transaminase (isomerizing)